MLSVRAELRRGDFALSVAFEAPTPGVIALFGRSGCGKTTVVHAIAGLLTPARGHIAVDGEVYFGEGVNVPSERRRVGCVFQEARLFPHRSVLGNLRYGLRRVPHAAQRFAEDEVVDLLGLRELLARRPRQLSGGERHRVAIGRALLSQPRLLLLDEPLAAQDLARRGELLPYLERVCSQLRVPIVYVSHQFDEVVRLATTVVVLEQGMVAAQGDVSELSRSPVLRAIVGPEAVGAVVDGRVEGRDARTGLARVRFGKQSLSVGMEELAEGRHVRVRVLARDVLVAAAAAPAPAGADVLDGCITAVEAEASHSLLVEVDVGGARLLARVASAADGLAPGQRVTLFVNAAWSRVYAPPAALPAAG